MRDERGVLVHNDDVCEVCASRERTEMCDQALNIPNLTGKSEDSVR